MKKNNNYVFGLNTFVIYFLLPFLLLVLSCVVNAQEKTDYSPKFSGYVRAWHQTDYALNSSQYLVKQARLGIAGSVNEFAGYKFLVDFTRLGKLSTSTTTIDSTKVLSGASATFSDILLDAVAILSPVENFEINAGQFKVPFSTDNLRSDQNADFANRPLHTGINPSMRDIGVTLSYKIKGDISAELVAGSFNGSGFNKSENDKTMDYVFRAVLSPVKNLNFSGNYYHGENQGAKLQYTNFGFDYKYGSLFLDAEYSAKVSEAPAKDIKGNSYFAFATYTFELPGNFVKYIIPGARYELYDPGDVKENDEIGRSTFGLTFGFAKLTFAHLRINYELFDYKDGSDNPDKLIIELQTKF